MNDDQSASEGLQLEDEEVEMQWKERERWLCKPLDVQTFFYSFAGGAFSFLFAFFSFLFGLSRTWLRGR